MAITYVLRYRDEKQKKKLENMAKRCGRSANSHILHIIDAHIVLNNQVDVFNKSGVIKYKK